MSSAMLQLSALTEASWPVMISSVVVTTLLVAVGFFVLTYSPSNPPNAPQMIKSGNLPVVGALDFFRRRTDFMMEQVRLSASGFFSFTVGQYHVVGLSGADARKRFFDSRELLFSEAYQVMLSGPPVKSSKRRNAGPDEARDDYFPTWFSRRLLAMMRKENLNRVLGTMCEDTKDRLRELVAQDSHLTDPFDSIYRIVFQLTLRTVGCNEVASDDAQREKLLNLYEEIERSSSATTVIFPWFPGSAKIRRAVAGAQIYKMFGDIIRERQKTGRREDDCLQFLLDEGDDTLKVITFVLGALFAGQLNSGVNAAWIAVYLANEPYWLGKVFEELQDACAKAGADKSAPLCDQLSSLTIEQWETSFPTIDLCLKEAIRIQTQGTALRRNLSGHDIMLGGHTIPNGSIVAYPIDDVHMDPNIYEHPEKWDPARYLPERAEDKKAVHAWVGWGAGRHPCLGMRFAKLEMNVIIALFVAAFDFELTNAKGNARGLPATDRNKFNATRPKDRPYLKFVPRKGGLA